MQKQVAFVLGALFACLMSGCFLVPAIDSFSQMGVRSSDRERLLSEDIKKFQDALYWGEPQQALRYVSEKSQADVVENLKSRKREERVVESRIDSIDFQDDSYSADVEVTERYYHIPYYMVNNRLRKQRWEFSLTSGWKIISQSSQEKSGAF